jgi:hypothetical protein
MEPASKMRQVEGTRGKGISGGKGKGKGKEKGGVAMHGSVVRRGDESGVVDVERVYSSDDDDTIAEVSAAMQISAAEARSGRSMSDDGAGTSSQSHNDRGETAVLMFLF